MHDALYQRLVRKIESLPDEQIYQVLDFIEFLESKYSKTTPVEASGLQKFAENLEDKLRKKAVSPNTIREAFQLITAADRVVSSVSEKGRRVLADLSTAFDSSSGEGAPDEEAEGRRGPGGEEIPVETPDEAPTHGGAVEEGEEDGEAREGGGPSWHGEAREGGEPAQNGEAREDESDSESEGASPPRDAPEGRP